MYCLVYLILKHDLKQYKFCYIKIKIIHRLFDNYLAKYYTQKYSFYSNRVRSPQCIINIEKLIFS